MPPMTTCVPSATRTRQKGSCHLQIALRRRAIQTQQLSMSLEMLYRLTMTRNRRRMQWFLFLRLFLIGAISVTV
uniref:Uncharacterized protein n=1 Tax=Babesia bovis TaxID=5865 RepID=S6BLI7_BABBO|nr:hypothetical protein [Babesia bovis]